MKWNVNKETQTAFLSIGNPVMIHLQLKRFKDTEKPWRASFWSQGAHYEYWFDTVKEGRTYLENYVQESINGLVKDYREKIDG